MRPTKSIGQHLKELREEAGLRQREVANRVGIQAGALSRIESGAGPVDKKDLSALVEAIDTGAARHFRKTLSRNWSELERPPFGHPDEDLLWRTHCSLVNLLEKQVDPETTRRQAHRLEEYRREIQGAVGPVESLDHNVAFMGTIGVGKTTALCAITGLKLDMSSRRRRPEVLEVGSGRTTVCEVHIVQGLQYGLRVEPRTNEEIEVEVREFAHQLIVRARGSWAEEGSEEESETDQAVGTTEEIARCIRNMSGLTPRFEDGEDGQPVEVDPAITLALEAPDPKRLSKEQGLDRHRAENVAAQTLAVEILSKMGLAGRRRREIMYSPEAGRDGLVWLHDVFRKVNNGRDPEFSLPRSIEVKVPDDVLGQETLRIRLVDTKGVDETVGRRDLVPHFQDPNALVVLCSGFGDAPSQSAHQLLELAKQGMMGNPTLKTAILVLPRGDEALDAKQMDGTEVESVENGYALKRAQVLSALERRETPCAAVEFFNSQDENPESVKGMILKLLEDVRKHNRAELERVVADVESMLANYGEARVRQIQEDAAKHLLSWLDTYENLVRSDVNLENSLEPALRRSHHSTVRASVRRQGRWDNLDYRFHLGSGASAMVNEVLGEYQKDFHSVTKNLEGLPDLAEAVGLISQSRRMIDTGIRQLLDESQEVGHAIHNLDMVEDGEHWTRCERRWGQGSGYRDQVVEYHREWFEENRANWEGQVWKHVSSQWKELLKRVRNILPVLES